MNDVWERRLKEIISSESETTNLTDSEIAEIMGISRQAVIRLRQKAGVPPYSKRREPYIKKAIRSILKDNPLISDRELTRRLQSKGYDVSKFTVSSYRKEVPRIQEKVLSTPSSVVKPFDRIVGRTGSMQPNLKKAEAAVCYPPNGLHTLIVGETGTGKTALAEIMFQLAHEKRKIDKSKFVRFNCADYYNVPQLLVSQLFGHVKGAFTGADSDKPGLVEEADGGILFLDEIHRLPSEGQEILFTIIDKGKYRRLGEGGKERDIRLMIIGATTEDIKSNLTLPFVRRIPMIIEMLPLRARGLQERYELIKNFFRQESTRIMVGINVSSEVVCSLLIYDCPGNIGQLVSDIQVACARAYVRHLENREKPLAVTILDFSENVVEGFLRRKYSEKSLVQYLDKGLRVFPDETQVWVFDESDTFLMPDGIYKFIEDRHRELEEEGVSSYQIPEVIGDELEVRLKRTLRNLPHIKAVSDRRDIGTLVGTSVMAVIDEMLAMAEMKVGKLSNDVTYYLSIHFHQSYERLRQNKPIMNPSLEQIIEGYPREFGLAKEMLNIATERLGIAFPEDEAGFIALYLAKNEVSSIHKNKVQVFVVTHGFVGKEMAAVTNRLLDIDFVRYICIDLDEKSTGYISETINAVKQYHEGRGILFLADMGTTVTLGEMIQKETGIPTKTVDKVHTAMVLDAAFKATHQDLNLDELYDSVSRERPYVGYADKKDFPKAIIVLCMTGLGAAIEIKSILENNLPILAENSIEMITLGLMSDTYLEKISEIRRTKQIIAVIGTVDPKIKDIPFISMNKAMDQQGFAEIQTLVRLHYQYLKPAQTVSDSLGDLLNPQLVFPKLEIGSKAELIRYVADAMQFSGHVNETYYEGIMQREIQGNTGFANGIALAHTYPEHTVHSAIAVVTLARPILWENDFYANIVVFMALKNPSEGIIKQIFNLGTNSNICQQIVAANTNNELYKIMLKIGGIQPC